MDTIETFGSPANEIRPAVGTPALYRIGSDRHAGRIVEVKRNGRTLIWEGSHGHREIFTLRADGRYLLERRAYGALLVGNTSPTYLDPDF